MSRGDELRDPMVEKKEEAVRCCVGGAWLGFSRKLPLRGDGVGDEKWMGELRVWLGIGVDGSGAVFGGKGGLVENELLRLLKYALAFSQLGEERWEAA